MENFTPKDLKQEARQRLASAVYNPKQLILLNTGVTVALGLLVSALNYLLNHQIGSTGGLNGLGMRSALQTVQTILSYAVSLFAPFWSAGLLFCLIRIVRNQDLSSGSMLEGFRRFPKLLSFSMFEVVVATLMILPITYLGAAIFMFTPLSASFTNSIEELLNSGALVISRGGVDPSSIPSDVLLQGILPLMVILLCLAIPVFLYLAYSLHIGPYLIMTDSVRGGMQAFTTSFRMMRGNRRKFLRLDLSYWWFYLAEAAAVCILYLDVILQMLQIEPFMNSTVLYFILLVVYSVAEISLHCWKKAERDTAYVLLYEQIAAPAETGSCIILP